MVIIFPCSCRLDSTPPKLKLSQCIMSSIHGPHKKKHFPNISDIFIHTLFVDKFSILFHDTKVYTLLE